MTISLDAPTRLSKLQAVNIILQARGKAHASSTTGTLDADVQEALNALAATNLRVQSEGWNFNTDYRILMTRDGSNYIQLPAGTLKLEPTYSSRDEIVSERGGRLYDAYNHTFVWGNDVYLNLTTAIAFEDLSMAAQWYITLAAALEYANESVPGDASTPPTAAEVRLARGLLETYDARLSATNNLRSMNPHFRRMRGTR